MANRIQSAKVAHAEPASITFNGPLPSSPDFPGFAARFGNLVVWRTGGNTLAMRSQKIVGDAARFLFRLAGDAAAARRISEGSARPDDEIRAHMLDFMIARAIPILKKTGPVTTFLGSPPDKPWCFGRTFWLEGDVIRHIGSVEFHTWQKFDLGWMDRLIQDTPIG
jgi:hypothetical protein